MTPTELEPGTVVQLIPKTVVNKMFAGCFMVVTESKGWGAKGFIKVPGGVGDVYYRAGWDEMEVVSKTNWVRED